ncbi:MAG: hypothetical protein ABIF10_02895 [Candidatus Woesearchaeota archaeon]
MIIRSFKIQPKVAEKIFRKHNVLLEEIYDVLKNDRPLFRRVGGDQYVAIGNGRSRHITIFFTYDLQSKEADITTAYPSDKKQIMFYKGAKNETKNGFGKTGGSQFQDR